MDGAPQFRFEHWQMLWVLAVVVGAAGVIWLGFRLRARALLALARVESLRRIAASWSRPRRLTKAALLVAALVCLVLVLMRPQGMPREVTVEKRGRDIVFLLDVSRSMLARDVLPNRLDRAKLAIEEMVGDMDGDRVGLIVFAGNWALKCPLTNDYHFFLTALRSASPNDVGRGGTDIGDAIRVAVNQVLRPEKDREDGIPKDQQSVRDIVLITDGEDLEESGPVSAAQIAGEYGVRISTVGIGDPDGARIPTANGEYLEYGGDYVRSHLDEKTLRAIAAATKGGHYVHVGTGAIDLTELYRKYLVAGTERESVLRSLRYRELYQWPLFVAIVLVVIEALLSGRRPERKERAS
jgi:Ca-activated chloride channel family protein